jgi:hypothetical protein
LLEAIAYIYLVIYAVGFRTSNGGAAAASKFLTVAAWFSMVRAAWLINSNHYVSIPGLKARDVSIFRTSLSSMGQTDRQPDQVNLYKVVAAFGMHVAGKQRYAQ